MAWGSAWYGRSYDLGRITFRDLVVAYMTCPAIQIYAVLAVLSAGTAFYLVNSLGEIILPILATLIVYPVAWYFIHRFILHGRWLYRMPWTASLWKRIHFDHHQDPHKLEVLFGAPSNTLPTIALVTLPVGYLLNGLGGAATAFAAGLLVTSFYEFCHCIQHLNYQPRLAFMKRIKQLHLAHHFHNENGNYGIVSFLPDRLFGTLYNRAKDWPRSSHVFNLGYDLEEARRFPWVMDLTGAPPRARPPGVSENNSHSGEDGDALRMTP